MQNLIVIGPELIYNQSNRVLLTVHVSFDLTQCIEDAIARHYVYEQARDHVCR